MKKFFTISLICFSLISCGGSGDDKVDTAKPDADNQPLAQAMNTGNVDDLPQDISITYDELARMADEFSSSYKSNLSDIYTGKIDYPVTKWSQFVSVEGWASQFNSPLVIGNGGTVHAMFGEIKEQKNAAFGTSIFAATLSGEELESFNPALINLISWLTNSLANDSNTHLTIKVANVSSSQFNKINLWFDTLAANVAITHCISEDEIAQCVDESTDLLVIASTNSSASLLKEALPSAKTLKVPVIYTHVHTWNTASWTNDILEHIGYYMQSPGQAGNFFVGDDNRHALWLNYTEMFNEQIVHKNLFLAAKNIAVHFKNNSFSYDLPNCDKNCSNDIKYKQQLNDGLSLIKEQFTRLDNNNTQIFGNDGYDTLKLLALIGDRFRQEISLPMDKATADIMQWSKGVFADFTVYNARYNNPVQSSLGNFSRTDFSHVTPHDVSINILSKPYMRAAGVYAIPGQTMKITRTDSNSSLNTTIHINAQRSGSSKPFDRLFDRPKYLKSTAVIVKPNDTITLTSPYGGPVYITYDAVDIASSFTFENVGEHAYWNGVEDNERFAEAIINSDYDWADVASEHVEVHSLITRMKTTLEDPITPNVEELARLMQKYTHGDLLALAGFTGPDIQVSTETTNFSTKTGIPLTDRNKVQHGIMDQPTCGYGCSGNPYDAGWRFSPLGHGDLHEIGHTIENGWFKFDGREGHATTNPYSYYTKHRAWIEEGIEPNCQSVKFDKVHDSLVVANGTAAPDAYMASIDMNDWNQGVALMIQILMSAQHEGALIDGWQLYPMLHILKREFDRIDGDDTNWNAGKAVVGFSSYSRAELANLTRNDFLLISTSFILGYDLQNYLEMFGLNFGAKAISQVQLAGLPAMPRNFFLPAENKDFCKTLAQPVISF